MIEFAINFLPNRRTGYSPIFLNYGYHPILFPKLIKGNVIATQERVNLIVQRLNETWDIVVRKMKHAQELQTKHYDTKHKPIEFRVNQLVLLSTMNLRIKGTPTKLKR